MVERVDTKVIIREPENYEDMLAKLRERDREAEARVQGTQAAGLQRAREELAQLRGRRSQEAAPLGNRAVVVDPQDPEVNALRGVIAETLVRLRQAIRTNPEANKAVLSGRVKLEPPRHNTVERPREL